MCGIAGFWTFRRLGEDPAAILQRMGDAIAHRGPDGSGIFWDEQSGVGLSHRRLAIVDLTEEGRQPMRSHSGRYICVFNGEIYNFEALRAELLRLGHTFRGRSDTEVMLAAFEEWGVERSLPKLSGMFAIAVWDFEALRLTLIRDRFGKKPLYIFSGEGVLAFGSELKALRLFPDFCASIDRVALTQYLRHNCVPGPRSIYQSVQKLSPGQFAVYRASEGTPVCERKEAYWSARAVRDAGRTNLLSGSEPDLLSAVDSCLRKSVAERMVADVPLGAFLSGGIDSSLIVALMQAQSFRPVKTFCIGFDEAEFNEAAHARAVAAHLGTDHTETILTSRDALDRVPKLPQIFDEPFADSSQLASLLVSEAARRDVTVALSGDGGDEVFCGYHRYATGRSVWSRLRAVPGPLRKTIAKAIVAMGPSAWDRILMPLRPLLPASLRVDTPGDRLLKLAGVMQVETPNEFYRQLVSHWPHPASIVIDGEEPLLDAQIAPLAGAERFAEEMMLVDALTYLPDDILVKVDRTSMAVSLEARAPFLDHQVFELASRLPFDMKLRGGVTKWVLRKLLGRYVPTALFERPKTGFAVPLERWLRGPLKDWAEELLNEQRLRDEGFFHPAPIRKLWNEHLSGRHRWQYQLWDVLMFQAWIAEQRRV